MRMSMSKNHRLLAISFCQRFLQRIDRDHLHGGGDGHAYEADEDASDPLRERERGGVGEAAEELDYDELEDDGAAEDRREHVVV